MLNFHLKITLKVGKSQINVHSQHIVQHKDFIFLKLPILKTLKSNFINFIKVPFFNHKLGLPSTYQKALIPHFQNGMARVILVDMLDLYQNTSLQTSIAGQALPKIETVQI